MMKKIILTVATSALFLGINTNVIANEMTTSSWSFPTPDQIQVSQNRVLLFCDANPYKCPVGLRAARAGGGAGSAGVGGGALVGPTSNSSANNISVVLAGDNSSITLSTSQDADDNNMTSNSDADAEIDLDQVLNYENNYK
jgi:hypothetical protein